MGYIYLVRKNIFPFQVNTFTVLGNITIAEGLIFILIMTVSIFIANAKFFLSKNMVFIYLIFFLILIFINFQKQHNKDINNDLIVKTNTPGSLTNTVKDIKQFYFSLLFYIFGYPADSRMTTEAELFDKINLYRIFHGLSSLKDNDFLCEIGQKRLIELLSVMYARRYEDVKQYSIVEKDKWEIAEIIQAQDQPNLAESIITAKWIRLFSTQRNIITNPNWNYGCATIMSYNTVFVFGKRN
jgi:hypothetical protein